MNYRLATIIFDMGNVMLPFDPLRPCAVLGERIGKTAHEVADMIYHNNLERWFEQGIIDGDRFTQDVSAVLSIELSTHEFHDLWVDMFTENAEVSRLVRQLKPHHHLILLSNTNSWHWHYALERFPIISEFQDRVLSYEVGVLKPHPAIYRAALEKTPPGDRVILIDDIEINVAAARIMGIHGIHFQSAEQLRRELLVLGCRFE
jgi:HAD superfamily hydrolase (TIGR01509 family)